MVSIQFERSTRIAALAALVTAGCGDGSGVTIPTDTDLQAIEVVTGLTQPVHLTAPPDDDRLFVVEQPGRIRIIEDGALLATPFLDITTNVGSGGERGLLSVAFHPDYASNGRFFVNYTGPDGATRVERYTVSADPKVADAASAQLILTVPQPFPNHNGGLVAFGPDGMLYIGMGDGGSSGDPQGNGQDPSTLLGALLRIDVDGGEPYAVPPDNPFLDRPGARPEIWAYGLRNPWRFSFDAQTGDLWIADVGQSSREEINQVPAGAGAGANFGWSAVEGTRPYAGDEPTGHVLPVFEYETTGGRCSVTGGYVYRGTTIPQLRGEYVFSDYCEGELRALAPRAGADPAETRLGGNGGSVVAFAQGPDRELYVLDLAGPVYRLDPA